MLCPAVDRRSSDTGHLLACHGPLRQHLAAAQGASWGRQMSVQIISSAKSQASGKGLFSESVLVHAPLQTHCDVPLNRLQICDRCLEIIFGFTQLMSASSYYPCLNITGQTVGMDIQVII